MPYTALWRVRFDGRTFRVSTQDRPLRYEDPADDRPTDEMDRRIAAVRRWEAGQVYPREHREPTRDADEASGQLYRSGLSEANADALVRLARANPGKTIEFDKDRWHREADYRPAVLTRVVESL